MRIQVGILKLAKKKDNPIITISKLGTTFFTYEIWLDLDYLTYDRLTDQLSMLSQKTTYSAYDLLMQIIFTHMT